MASPLHRPTPVVAGETRALLLVDVTAEVADAEGQVRVTVGGRDPRLLELDEAGAPPPGWAASASRA